MNIDWNNTTVERVGDNIWVRDSQGAIVCEAFYATDDDDMDGYERIPVRLESEELFVGKGITA